MTERRGSSFYPHSLQGDRTTWHSEENNLEKTSFAQNTEVFNSSEDKEGDADVGQGLLVEGSLILMFTSKAHSAIQN